jgi:hypothetical protein
MSKRSITLVGRASQLERHADHVSFLLTVKIGDRPDFIVECHAHRERDIEAFKLMDEGSLVGIIGKLQTLVEQLGPCIVRLDRLEILGKPLGVPA